MKHKTYMTIVKQLNPTQRYAFNNALDMALHTKNIRCAAFAIATRRAMATLYNAPHEVKTLILSRILIAARNKKDNQLTA